MSLQMIGFGFSPMQQPMGGCNPLAMLMQGLQMMGGGFNGGGCPGTFGSFGGGGGAFGPMGAGNPFGAFGNPGAALGGCFGGGPENAYQAGFQAGMQAATGGGAMSPYQAGFQQGMASAGGGFGGPGFAGPQGPGGFGNPLMEILNLLMRMMGGMGMGGPGMGGPGMGGPGCGMPGFGNGGGDPFGGGNFGPPGGFAPHPHHHHGDHYPGGGDYNPGPATQHSIHDGGIREVYDRGQMNQGKLQYTAGMQIDCDGSGSSHGDPCYQSQTSMRMANGQSLNADRTPYIVLPPQMAKKYGVHLGDMALVRHGDKVSPAIFGDVGPRNKLGEGSVRLAQNLGINSSPTHGGTSGGVEYTVFPGSGRGVKWTPENTTTEALWERIRAQQGGGT